MDSLSAKLNAEIEKKRKSSEPLRDAVTAVSESASANDVIPSAQEKKKKVYMTNGQAKKLQAELSVRVGAASLASGTDSILEDSGAGPLSPEQISANKSAIEGKKVIPRAEVFKRLRSKRSQA